MALNATIYRCRLAVSDIGRSYYQTHQLTIARHPSETDERMMVRLLAFALNADENLAFTRGLCRDDEPELWQRSLSDEILLWIELGQPDEKRIRKACAKSQRVLVYCYQPRAASVWWRQNAERLDRFDHLSVFMLPDNLGTQISALAQRNMDLQCTVQDDDIWLSDASDNIHFTLQRLR